MEGGSPGFWVVIDDSSLMALPLVMVVVTALGGYLIGSIPFGYLLSRLAGLGDIRRVGSGNIGATNVLRTGRKDIAALTLLLDGGKGVMAVLVARIVFHDPVPALVAGVAAVVGHCTSVWMRGRGGKGVATGLGVIIAWAWPIGLACCLVWLLGAATTKRSSAAALLAFAAATLLMLALRSPDMALAAGLVSSLVIVRHHSNIARLLAGTEPRIGSK